MTSIPHAHTYVAGEDPQRLQASAAALGLPQQRPVRPPIRRPNHHSNNSNKNGWSAWKQLLFTDAGGYVAAQMHSVGALAQDEQLDPTGHLQHYVSVRKRRKPTTISSATRITTDYGALQDLFERPAEMGSSESNDRLTALETDEEEEGLDVTVESGGSLAAAVFGIIKGTVGPAILFLPHGFQSSGYAVAIPAMVLATGMYIYSATILLECWSAERQKNLAMAQTVREFLASMPENSNTTNTGTAYKKPDYQPRLLTYSELARRALGPYAAFTTLGIALFQYGVCLTYLIFVAQNWSKLTQHRLPLEYCVWIMVLIEIPLGWIADIRKLIWSNVMATLMIAYGLLAVVWLALVLGLERNDDDDDDGQFAFVTNLQALPAITENWFLFIGTSFFMMEGGITLVVPLQEAVSSPDDQKKFPWINGVTTTNIVLFYIIFSFWCSAGYGDGLRTALTASLEGTVATTVQLAYSSAIVLTYPLQAFPALQVTAKALLSEPNSTNGAVVPWQRCLLSTVITVALGVLGVTATDSLGNVVSILGSLFGIPLALVFPPLMHNALVVKHMVDDDQRRRRLWGNYAVVGMGVFAMGAASYATVVSWDQGAKGG